MYIKPSQVAYINRIKERVNGEEILLQVDFSENATLSNQLKSKRRIGAMIKQPSLQHMPG